MIIIHQDLEMITSETPYKLAEIIRDTWPGLYRPIIINYKNQKDVSNERVLDCNRE